MFISPVVTEGDCPRMQGAACPRLGSRKLALSQAHGRLEQCGDVSGDAPLIPFIDCGHILF